MQNLLYGKVCDVVLPPVQNPFHSFEAFHILFIPCSIPAKKATFLYACSSRPQNCSHDLLMLEKESSFRRNVFSIVGISVWVNPRSMICLKCLPVLRRPFAPSWISMVRIVHDAVTNVVSKVHCHLNPHSSSYEYKLVFVRKLTIILSMSTQKKKSIKSMKIALIFQRSFVVVYPAWIFHCFAF